MCESNFDLSFGGEEDYYDGDGSTDDPDYGPSQG